MPGTNLLIAYSRRSVAFRSVFREYFGIIAKSLSQLFRAETKFIHNVFFIAQQLARCAVLHGEHIPSGTVRHPAFSRLYQGRMFMETAAMAVAATCPACFAVEV